MLYDKIFFVVWSLVLSITLLIFGFERFDISLEQSFHAQSIVHFSSPPLSTFGDGALIVQTSDQGVINDAGFPLFTLELVNPLPFTQISVDGKVKYLFMHAGVYSKSFSDFYGSDIGYVTLKYVDSQGNDQEIFAWFGYPDYDQSSFTIVYHFRAAVQDEIPKTVNLRTTDPEKILRGEVSNIRLQILAPHDK